MAGAQTSMAYGRLQEDLRMLRYGATGRAFEQPRLQDPFGLVPSGKFSMALGSLFPGMSGYDPDYSGMTLQQYQTEIHKGLSNLASPMRNDAAFSVGGAIAGFALGGIPGGLMGLTAGGLLDLGNAVTGSRVRERESLSEGLMKIGERNFGDISRADSRDMAEMLQFAVRSPEGRRRGMNLDVIQENILSFDAAGGFSTARSSEDMDAILEGVVNNAREFANKFKLRQSQAVQIMAELQSQMIVNTDQMGEFASKMGRFSGLTGLSPIEGVQLGMQGVNMFKGTGVAPDVAFNMAMESRLQAERLTQADPRTRMLVNSYGGADNFAMTQLNTAQRYISSPMGNLNIMGLLGGSDLVGGLSSNLIGAGDFVSEDPFNMLRMQGRDSEFLGALGVTNVQSMIVTQAYSLANEIGAPTDADALAGLAVMTGLVGTPQEFKAALAGARDTVERDFAAEAGAEFNDIIFSSFEENMTQPGNWWRQLKGTVSDAWYNNSLVRGVGETINNWDDTIRRWSDDRSDRRRGLTNLRSEESLSIQDRRYWADNEESLLGERREIVKQINQDLGISAYNAIKGFELNVENTNAEETSGSNGFDFSAYALTLAIRESSNNPHEINSLGFSGLYQMGAAALEDAGFIKTGTVANLRDETLTSSQQHAVNNAALRSSSNWTGVHGVNSLNDFLNNSDAQTEALRLFTEKNEGYLENSIGGPLSDIFNDQERAGFLMAAHLGGHSNAYKLYAQDIASSDNNGTSIRDYYNLGYKTQNSSIDRPKNLSQVILESLNSNEIVSFEQLVEDFDSSVLLDTLNTAADSYTRMSNVQRRFDVQEGDLFEELPQELRNEILTGLIDTFGASFESVISIQQERADLVKSGYVNKALSEHPSIRYAAERSQGIKDYIQEVVPYMTNKEIEGLDSFLKGQMLSMSSIGTPVERISGELVGRLIPGTNNRDFINIVKSEMLEQQAPRSVNEYTTTDMVYRDIIENAENQWSLIVANDELHPQLIESLGIRDLKSLPTDFNELSAEIQADFLTAISEKTPDSEKSMLYQSVDISRNLQGFGSVVGDDLTHKRAVELLEDLKIEAFGNLDYTLMNVYEELMDKPTRAFFASPGAQRQADKDFDREMKKFEKQSTVASKGAAEFIKTFGENFHEHFEDKEFTRLPSGTQTFLRQLRDSATGSTEKRKLYESVMTGFETQRRIDILNSLVEADEVHSTYKQFLGGVIASSDLEDPSLSPEVVQAFRTNVETQLRNSGTFKVTLPTGDDISNFRLGGNLEQFREKIEGISKLNQSDQFKAFAEILNDIPDTDVQKDLVGRLKEQGAIDQNAFNFLQPHDYTVPATIAALRGTFNHSDTAIRVELVEDYTRDTVPKN